MNQETITGTSGPAKPPSVSAPSEFRLPEIENVAALLADTSIVLPDPIIPGILDRGCKGVIGAGSKIGKTWILLALGLAVATGTPFLGWPTRQGRVLYINFEILKPYFLQRLKEICKKENITDTSRLDTLNLRGHADMLGKLSQEIITRIKGQNYVLVIIDPIYKGLGGRDENSAGDISELCNELERIAVQCNVAVFYAAHFSKGNQSKKSAMDRISGSGVWTRDADTIITLTKHQDTQSESYTVDLILRNSPPKDSFVISQDFPVWKLRTDLDPNELEKKPGRPSVHSPDDLLEILGAEFLTTGDWEKRAMAAEIPYATFARLKKELVNSGQVVKETGRKWRKAG